MTVMIGGAGGVGGAAGSPGRAVSVAAGGVAGGGGAGYRGAAFVAAAQPVVIEAGMLYSVLAERFPGRTPDEYGAAVKDLLACVRRNIAESGGTSTTIGYRYDPADLAT